ncbi:Dam family site-specific DNA-(adenine-N6)-methyltransferase [Pectobacterium aquaticum]|uniref:Dam family site-specific DNA-(adenine-N6)-methyltransferase n=1 Tax=Pectobacterium aquaticum TaxID=2204145 RepID=UPI000E28077A|nr:Dam family site-specific DNA-(adenine-N6)-methyltransferase [Pectobacterium aquaticum]UEM40062.1 Dam family site-specific DNA-(adenine-N6)-methyltransferase [Pectobacterium aquaticum]
MIRPFIKWAGGKTRALPDLLPLLPKGDVLIEPFVGGASVFLNTEYRHYVLADINPDLINLYRVAVANTDLLISDAKVLFQYGNNKTEYYVRRRSFNYQCRDGGVPNLPAAALFLYLNRHGYNGMCRYNRDGGFNVPFGQYRAPYFPEQEIRLFAEKARDTKAIFRVAPFSETITRHARPSAVIYCDPPYLPASDTANFTQYHTAAFSIDHHITLAAALADANRIHGAQCVISNSDTPATREIYQGFKFHEIAVQRSISANAITRGAAKEVIGVLTANCQESLPLLNGSTLRGLNTGFSGELRGMGL